jgi:hypothetical protein
MHRTTLVLLATASLLAANAAQAQSADDKKWVAECMRDNAGAGVGTPIVRAYCTCMTDKMSENETRSVSVWELANPRAKAACDKESGWK